MDVTPTQELQQITRRLLTRSGDDGHAKAGAKTGRDLSNKRFLAANGDAQTNIVEDPLQLDCRNLLGLAVNPLDLARGEHGLDSCRSIASAERQPVISAAALSVEFLRLLMWGVTMVWEAGETRWE